MFFFFFSGTVGWKEGKWKRLLKRSNKNSTARFWLERKRTVVVLEERKMIQVRTWRPRNGSETWTTTLWFCFTSDNKNRPCLIVHVYEDQSVSSVRSDRDQNTMRCVLMHNVSLTEVNVAWFSLQWPSHSWGVVRTQYNSLMVSLSFYIHYLVSFCFLSLSFTLNVSLGCSKLLNLMAMYGRRKRLIRLHIGVREHFHFFAILLLRESLQS